MRVSLVGRLLAFRQGLSQKRSLILAGQGSQPAAPFLAGHLATVLAIGTGTRSFGGWCYA